MLMSMAAKEKTSSRWSAWLAPILFLLAAVAAAGPASALTCGALQTRTWEKTSTPLDSRLDESLQLLNLHQQNGGAGYDDALGSPLAAEGGPKPTPNFVEPTNAPQLPPTDLPPGHSVRVMPPTEQYPNGYWVQTNAGNQPINPATGKPPGNVTQPVFRSQVHVPLPPPEGQ
jgi:hypothetical protein